MDINMEALKESLSAANSAFMVSAIAEKMDHGQRILQEVNRQSIERDATLVAGAEANVAQKQLLEQQLEIIQKQNELLYDNFSKLKEMYDDQVQANKEAKDELERSRKYNKWMMTISIIAMLAAIASPIVTLLVSR